MDKNTMDFSSFIKEHDFEEELKEIEDFLNPISNCYSNFSGWINGAVKNGLRKGTHSIIIDTITVAHHDKDSTMVEFNREILYTVIMKNTPNKKKICIIFVNPKFRRKGVGTKIMKNAKNMLSTFHPLITVCECLFEDVNPFLEECGFTVDKVGDDYCDSGGRQFYYNSKVWS